ncbi:unnamed protein product [Cercospora beticola]|nr:unnamed protein product [Cercospora beticola]
MNFDAAMLISTQSGAEIVAAATFVDEQAASVMGIELISAKQFCRGHNNEPVPLSVCVALTSSAARLACSRGAIARRTPMALGTFLYFPWISMLSADEIAQPMKLKPVPNPDDSNVRFNQRP